MGKIRCAGELCWDEETGRTFFLPDPKCDPDSYAKVRSTAVIDGISFTQPIKKEKKK